MAHLSYAPFNVLLAEDDYFIADEIAKALEHAGATVVGPTPSLKRTFDALADNPVVQLAVLDINLQDEFVFLFADALRQTVDTACLFLRL